MADEWTVRRRKRRVTPMRQRRAFGHGTLATAGVPLDFPGAPMPEPEPVRERARGWILSFAIHAGVLLAIVLMAALAPEELVEQIIEVTRLPETESSEPSAPRPKVIAESSGGYAPAPQAVPTLIQNPAIVQRRAAIVQARALKREAVSVVAAPRQVARAAVEVAQVRAYQSVASATASAVEVEAAAAVIEGPVDLAAPVGRSAGPRQVATGSTAGIADPSALGTGSSVRDGIASNRDVFGGREGARARVDWEVGAGGGRGSGGGGTGPGGVPVSDCVDRPAVGAYLQRVKDRVEARWTDSSSQGSQRVVLRFHLDVSGSASRIQVSQATSETIGRSAAEAMRASSPFEPMPDTVRCLSGTTIILTFSSDTY